MTNPLRRNVGLAIGALFASGATLVCCVLPAVLVTVGAGATLATLLTAVPQLVWLSEHKLAVFLIAAICLGIAGAAIWRARSLPCPAEPEAARQCLRLRRWSLGAWVMGALMLALGTFFAFLLPA